MQVAQKVSESLAGSAREAQTRALDDDILQSSFCPLACVQAGLRGPTSMGMLEQAKGGLQFALQLTIFYRFLVYRGIQLHHQCTSREIGCHNDGGVNFAAPGGLCPGATHLVGSGAGDLRPGRSRRHGQQPRSSHLGQPVLRFQPQGGLRSAGRGSKQPTLALEVWDYEHWEYSQQP